MVNEILDYIIEKTIKDTYEKTIKEKDKIIAFLIKELLHYDICDDIICSNKNENKDIKECYYCILTSAKNSITDKDKEK